MGTVRASEAAPLVIDDEDDDAHGRLFDGGRMGVPARVCSASTLRGCAGTCFGLGGSGRVLVASWRVRVHGSCALARKASSVSP